MPILVLAILSIVSMFCSLTPGLNPSEDASSTTTKTSEATVNQTPTATEFTPEIPKNTKTPTPTLPETTTAQPSQWSTPIDLYKGRGSARSPDIAVDAEGTLIVVWEENPSNSDSQISWTTRPDGGVWSAPANLSGVYLDKPVLAIDTNSTAHMVWGIDDVMYSQKPRGGSWTVPVPATNDYGRSLEQDLAVGGDGTVHIVWENYFDVYYASKPPGGSWSQPVNLSQGVLVAYDTHIAVDGALNVHVIWSHDDIEADSYEILYSTQAHGSGIWSTPLKLSGTYNPFPAMAMDGNDVLHVVWMDFVDDYSGIHYKNKTPDGNWSDPIFLFSIPYYPTFQEIIVQAIVADAAGTVDIFWNIRVGDQSDQFYYASCSSGGTWSEAQKIPLGVRSDNSPAIALDRQGSLHIVWRGSHGEIFYSSNAPVR